MHGYENNPHFPLAQGFNWAEQCTYTTLQTQKGARDPWPCFISRASLLLLVSKPQERGKVPKQEVKGEERRIFTMTLNLITEGERPALCKNTRLQLMGKQKSCFTSSHHLRARLLSQKSMREETRKNGMEPMIESMSALLLEGRQTHPMAYSSVRVAMAISALCAGY